MPEIIEGTIRVIVDDAGFRQRHGRGIDRFRKPVNEPC
jgi:hypothetical protein